MKLKKFWGISGLIIVLTLLISLPSFAIDENSGSVGKGYLEFKATVSSWIEKNIIISLHDENGISTQLILSPQEQFENIVKLPAGKYTVEYVEVVGVPASDYLVEFAHHVTVEKDKGGAYGIRVSGRGDAQASNPEIGTPIKTSGDDEEIKREPQRTTNPNSAGDTARVAEKSEQTGETEKPTTEALEDDPAKDVRRDLLGRPVSQNPFEALQGFQIHETPSQIGQSGLAQEFDQMKYKDRKKEENKKNYGIYFLKKNWFSLLLIIFLSAGTLIYKKMNDTL